MSRGSTRKRPRRNRQDSFYQEILHTAEPTRTDLVTNSDAQCEQYRRASINEKQSSRRPSSILEWWGGATFAQAASLLPRMIVWQNPPRLHTSFTGCQTYPPAPPGGVVSRRAAVCKPPLRRSRGSAPLLASSGEFHALSQSSQMTMRAFDLTFIAWRTPWPQIRQVPKVSVVTCSSGAR
jgi:hypothetical protein